MEGLSDSLSNGHTSGLLTTPGPHQRSSFRISCGSLLRGSGLLTKGVRGLDLFVMGILLCGLFTSCGVATRQGLTSTTTLTTAPLPVFNLACSPPHESQVLVEVVRREEVAGSSSVPITIACAQHSYPVVMGLSTNWNIPVADGGGGSVDIVADGRISLLPLPAPKNLSGCEADQALLVKDLKQLFAGHPLYVSDRAEADQQLLRCVHHLFG